FRGFAVHHRRGLYEWKAAVRFKKSAAVRLKDKNWLHCAVLNRLLCASKRLAALRRIKQAAVRLYKNRLRCAVLNRLLCASKRLAALRRIKQAAVRLHKNWLRCAVLNRLLCASTKIDCVAPYKTGCCAS
ncbi:hypothetical protein PV325_010295, partial [Microctonus aethiopoides]